MPAMEGEERSSVLMALFQTIVNDMKENAPAFEDLANKTTKLHSSLRATIASTTLFLEAFQRVADVATNSRGATKEIGKALTRLCLRQRSIETKLKTFTSALLERLVVPLQETVAEWQKAVVQLDKDHARECKKARADIKRASGDTVRLQRKAKKGKSDAKERLESAMHGVNSLYSALEESERKHVRLALIQERKQFCHFITCVDPIVAAEVSMINEAVHLQEILDSLCSLAADPDNLPEASEHVITDASRADIKLTTAFQQSPPGSPASLVRSSRRSSMSSMSSLASASEADSAIGISPNHGSGQKISHGSEGDLLGDHSSLSSKHSSYHSSSGGGGRGSGAAGVGGSAAGDEVFDSVSLHAPLGMAAAPYQQRSLDRPHTISGAPTTNGILLGEMMARQQHATRPTLQTDTFVPPPSPQLLLMGAGAGAVASELSYATSHSRTPSPVMLAPPSPATVVMPPPPKPSRGVVRRGTVHGSSGGGGPAGAHRNLPPRKLHPKPVALPSVPFMASEPVYMNTQELAARIAEKRHASELQQQPMQQQQHETPVQATADRKSTADLHSAQLPQQQHQTAAMVAAAAAAAVSMRNSTIAQPDQTSNPGMALANAIKELEATTAALNDECDGSGLPLPPPPDSLKAAGCKAPVDEDQLQPLREVSFTKLSLEASYKTDRAVNPIDHDALRIAQGRPVQTPAGPAVLRRSASVKPAPPMRKSSSVTSPRSLEAECVSKGVSVAGSVSSIPNEAAVNSWTAAASPPPALEPAHPGRDRLTVTASVACVAAIRHDGAVTADRGVTAVTAAAAAIVPGSAEHGDRNSKESVATPSAAAAATSAPAAPASSARASAAVKIAPSASAVAKAPPPAVAAKPAARRDIGGGGSSGGIVGPHEPAARPTSSLNGALPSSANGSAAESRSSSSNSSTASATPAAISLPPWERPPAVTPAVTLPPWERGSLAAAASTPPAASASVTGQSAVQQPQHREAAAGVPAFSRLGADFMASLGAKLTAGSATVGDLTASSAAAARDAAGTSASATVAGTGAAAAPVPYPGAAATAGSEENLMSQIHTGVKLKRTQTDDRSAPRVT